MVYPFPVLMKNMTTMAKSFSSARNIPINGYLACLTHTGPEHLQIILIHNLTIKIHRHNACTHAYTHAPTHVLAHAHTHTHAHYTHYTHGSGIDLLPMSHQPF